jgi:two-component system, cell cycle sensor histidine kinase and response regulator CckA
MTSPKSAQLPAVLVVDDEPAVLRLMERSLADAGYQVFTALDALRAIQVLGDLATIPGALVTDLRMEPMDGPDLAKLVVRRWPNIQILFVSGFDSEHLELTAPLLPKPFSPAQLVDAVGRLLAVPVSLKSGA